MNGYVGLSILWVGYLKYKIDKFCKYLLIYV